MKIKEIIEELSKYDENLHLCWYWREAKDYRYAFDIANAVVDKDTESLIVDIIPIISLNPIKSDDED